MEAGTITLISVLINAVAMCFAPWVAKKLASQGEKIKTAEEQLTVLSSGIGTIERAVEENKDMLAGSGPGDKIASTIRTYGPAAKVLVDSARDVAAKLRLQAESNYTASLITRERSERAAYEANLAAGKIDARTGQEKVLEVVKD